MLPSYKPRTSVFLLSEDTLLTISKPLLPLFQMISKIAIAMKKKMTITI